LKTSKDSNDAENSKTPGSTYSPNANTLREPEFSPIQAPRSLARSGTIDDSALRAFAIKGASVATPIRIGKKKDAYLHINRPLEFGFSLSPDFAPSIHWRATDLAAASASHWIINS
jgi:hypothetical protein